MSRSSVVVFVVEQLAPLGGLPRSTCEVEHFG